MRTKKGVVVSTKMDKTIVVAVDSYKMHSKYKKRYRVTKKFFAHDENNQYALGSTVTIEETRPMSKNKCWTVVSE
ncbi:MAG: 30S ribosomal protein S17 [Patescibacteria group bacterium]|nr:30S ribosomal protein S17 [Patescibacteria group bacterium]